MRHNTPETAARTTADLVRAAERGLVVTLTYRKPGADEELRTVEVTDVRVSEAGDLLVVGWCRTRGERRTFRVDRVTCYTVHGALRRTPAHVALLVAEAAEWAELAAVPHTGYEAEAAWYADLADRAEARGQERLAAGYWEAAELAWELADLG